MEDQIKEIKDKIDIVDYISQSVELKKSGRNFKGICPFHQEKSPSFVVSPERQIWHCFGSCGEGGDVIKFLMKWDNLTFLEALKELAIQAGVELESVQIDDQESKRKEKVYEMNNLAMRYYSYVLHNTKYGQKAVEYLKDRGINEKIIQTFELGYAPASWDSLSKFLQKKGFASNDLVMAGLVSSSTRGHTYDRFRNRLMFPIKDVKGNVIAFAGRLLDPDAKAAKYINTSETPVYHKRQSLYGIHLTKDAIRQEENVYIVEGEFDMILPFQKGICNIVAIKGAALTKEQLNVLKRYTGKITLALDTDEAGIEAMKRGIREAEEFDFDIRVAEFSHGKDPDEAARDDFVTFKKELSNAIPFYDFLFQTIRKKYPEQTSYAKKKVADELVPYLRNITNVVVQSHYIKLLAKMIEVSEESIQKMINYRSKNRYRTSFVKRTKNQLSREEMIQRYLMSYIFQYQNPHKVVAKLSKYIDADDFSIPALGKIFKQFHEYLHQNQSKYSFNAFMSTLPSELQSVADEVFLFKTGNADETDEQLWNIIYELKEKSYRRKIAYYSKQNSKEADQKIQQISKAMHEIDKSELEKTFSTL